MKNLLTMDRSRKTKISSLNLKQENKKWYFIASGGERRRWYGNIINVLNWDKDGRDLKKFNDKLIKRHLEMYNLCLKKVLHIHIRRWEVAFLMPDY